MAIRVLHVIAGLGSGGAESMLMNWYRNIDRNVVQFDFLLRSNENIYADEIASLGGRVFYTAEFPRRYFKNKKQTIKFFKEHAKEYSAIHVHCNALLYVNVLKIAKKQGIKVRIIHSHSTKTKNKIFEIFHRINKKRINKLANGFFACSKDAGKWAFNDSINYQVIANGIDVKKFKYSESARKVIREELNIEDKFVIGHVGRFLDVKNHEFLIEAFDKVVKECDDAVLVLVGTGPLENDIRKEVEKRHLNNRVYFLGVRKDVHRIYSAMDVFVFPSKYEGLPVVLIEAQTNGLKCVVSNNIPKECKISDKIDFLPIDNPILWKETIIKKEGSCKRGNYWKQTIDAGFDVSTSVKVLQTYYLGEKND